jgi:hypothetical protein
MKKITVPSTDFRVSSKAFGTSGQTKPEFHATNFRQGIPPYLALFGDRNKSLEDFKIAVWEEFQIIASLYPVGTPVIIWLGGNSPSCFDGDQYKDEQSSILKYEAQVLILKQGSQEFGYPIEYLCLQAIAEINHFEYWNSVARKQSVNIRIGLYPYKKNGVESLWNNITQQWEPFQAIEKFNRPSHGIFVNCGTMASFDALVAQLIASATDLLGWIEELQPNASDDYGHKAEPENKKFAGHDCLKTCQDVPGYLRWAEPKIQQIPSINTFGFCCGGTDANTTAMLAFAAKLQASKNSQA